MDLYKWKINFNFSLTMIYIIYKMLVLLQNHLNCMIGFFFFLFLNIYIITENPRPEEKKA